MPTESPATILREQELHAREQRHAAIHEAAHEVLICYFGGMATSKIWRNPIVSDEATAWQGRCAIGAEPGQMRFPKGAKKASGVVRRCPTRWRRYAGLAGFVAERMYEGRIEPWDVREAYDHALDMNELSEADLTMIAGPVHDRDIAQTIRYLQAVWAAVERRAAELIEAASHESASGRT